MKPTTLEEVRKLAGAVAGSTFAKVFGAVDPEALQEAQKGWLQRVSTHLVRMHKRGQALTPEAIALEIQAMVDLRQKMMAGHKRKAEAEAKVLFKKRKGKAKKPNFLTKAQAQAKRDERFAAEIGAAMGIAMAPSMASLEATLAAAEATNSRFRSRGKSTTKTGLAK